MTPKEKALIIYNHFTQIINELTNETYTKDVAKACSLFSVDMILQPFLIDYSLIKHWKEIKQEIEKL